MESEGEMKTIVLHCVGCGSRRRFRGEDVKEILEAFDSADWQDLPDSRNDLPKGTAPAICPDCDDADVESFLND